MTYEEALTEMLKLADAELQDEEADHSLGDEILVDFLRSLGYDELCDAWERIPKWYA